MNIPSVDLTFQNNPLVEDYLDFIRTSISHSTFIGGSTVTSFESEFANYLSIPYFKSCANGTDALVIALKALGVSPGDEVITTALSWISTSEAITVAGAVPVFVDIDPLSLCLDPSLIEPSITDKTVGIIPVHLYGNLADIVHINKIAAKYGLWVIEDTAQAHGTRNSTNHLAGTLSDIATFSFYPTKNLGAFGDAGGLSTNNPTYYDFFCKYSNHGIKNVHTIEGINSRMDPFQAYILLKKLPLLEESILKRREIASIYLSELSSTEQLTLPLPSCNSQHSYHLFTVQLNRRDSLRKFLNDSGIQTQINYPVPLPLLPCYSHLPKNSDFPVARKVCSSLLQLPIYPGLSEANTYFISSKVKEFFAS